MKTLPFIYNVHCSFQFFSKVVRIQNPKVYYLYDALKVYVAKALSKQTDDVETSPLWHATKKAKIDKIKKNNFDRGLSGDVGELK